MDMNKFDQERLERPSNQFDATISMMETCRAQGVTILQKVGQGSYGAVFSCRRNNYKGRHATMALKVIDTKGADSHYVDTFLPREIDILLQIQHPFIIYVYAIIQKRHKYYFFMRYAEQGDLLEYLNKVGPVEESRARIWCTQLACAIDYLHNRNIAHRDIKCENILITAHHNTKLSDFGFAKVYKKDNGQPELLSTFCGTKQYACTEILNYKPYNPEKADMWSLGVVLYLTLVGQPPFKGSTTKKVLENQRKPLEYKKGLFISDQLMKTFPKIFVIEEKRLTVRQFLKSDWVKMESRFSKNAINVERPQKPNNVPEDVYERQQFLKTADINNKLGGDREITFKPPLVNSYTSTGIQVPTISETYHKEVTNTSKFLPKVIAGLNFVQHLENWGTDVQLEN